MAVTPAKIKGILSEESEKWETRIDQELESQAKQLQTIFRASIPKGISEEIVSNMIVKYQEVGWRVSREDSKIQGNEKETKYEDLVFSFIEE